MRVTLATTPTPTTIARTPATSARATSIEATPAASGVPRAASARPARATPVAAASTRRRHADVRRRDPRRARAARAAAGHAVLAAARARRADMSLGAHIAAAARAAMPGAQLRATLAGVATLPRCLHETAPRARRLRFAHVATRATTLLHRGDATTLAKARQRRPVAGRTCRATTTRRLRAAPRTLPGPPRGAPRPSVGRARRTCHSHAKRAGGTRGNAYTLRSSRLRDAGEQAAVRVVADMTWASESGLRPTAKSAAVQA